MSLAINTILSSDIFSGFTIILISLPACIAKDFSTPSNESATLSNSSSLLIYVSNVSLLAPGLEAEIASAACTKIASIVCGSTSPWCACTAFITFSFSLYFFNISTPISTCVPSISWSKAFPISCSNPALLANFASNSNSSAIILARLETSIEWLSTFCP